MLRGSIASTTPEPSRTSAAKLIAKYQRRFPDFDDKSPPKPPSSRLERLSRPQPVDHVFDIRHMPSPAAGSSDSAIVEPPMTTSATPRYGTPPSRSPRALVGLSWKEARNWRLKFAMSEKPHSSAMSVTRTPLFA